MVKTVGVSEFEKEGISALIVAEGTIYSIFRNTYSEWVYIKSTDGGVVRGGRLPVPDHANPIKDIVNFLREFYDGGHRIEVTMRDENKYFLEWDI